MLSWGFPWLGDAYHSQLQGCWSQRAEGRTWPAACPCCALQHTSSPRPSSVSPHTVPSSPLAGRGCRASQALSLMPGPSIPGSQPDAWTVLQLPLSPQGCLHHIPPSSSCSSAWILLPVWPHQGKAGFYGRQPTPFLPSRGARHWLPPHRLCWGWWVLHVAAQPVVMGGVEKNSWQPRGTGCPPLLLPHCPILSLADQQRD